MFVVPGRRWPPTNTASSPPATGSHFPTIPQLHPCLSQWPAPSRFANTPFTIEHAPLFAPIHLHHRIHRTHITPFNHSQVIGRSLPEVVWRSRKHPYFLRRALGENVRPILRWDAMNKTSPRVLEPQHQAAGHFNAWRPATRSDWQQLHTV